MSALVFDLESDGLRDATKMWCLSASDIEEVVVDSWTILSDNLEEGVKYLGGAGKLIGHNIIGFDLPFLRDIYNWQPANDVEIVDTLVISRLLNPDRRKPFRYEGKSGPHSLDCWAYRVGKRKPSHDDWSQYSLEMLHRNREDVAINKLVLELLESEMEGHDWAESIELENNVLRIITQQEINGVYFDKDAATNLVTELDNRVRVIDNELEPRLPIHYSVHGVPVRKPFKNDGRYSKMVLDWFPELADSDAHFVSGPFSRIEEHRLDINSIKQVKDYFLEQGWIPTEYNFSKKTGQPTSPKLTEDSYGTITGGMGPQIKERLTLCHRRNQIQGWLDRVRPDGRLSAYANTCGTPTGRMRHSNVVNIPKAVCYPKGHERVGELVYATDSKYQYVPYGTEMRSLFTVPKSYKLVGCDAEQLELRLLAHFMGDDLYIQEILRGDIHAHNQRLAGLPTRDDAKTFIYAFLYGAGDEKLGSIIEGTAEDGARLRKAFLDGLPHLKKLITKVKRAANKGWLKGLDGRKLHLRRSDNGEVIKHKALNLYIQGAGAVVMKKAIVILDDLILSDTSIDAKKVLDMHDEFQFEVLERDAERVGELCVRAIVLAGEAFNLRIPMAGQFKVGLNWAETH